MQFFVDLDPHSIFPKCDCYVLVRMNTVEHISHEFVFNTAIQTDRQATGWMDGRTDTVAQQRLSPVASTYVECVMMAATCRMLGRSDVPADPSTA